MNYSGDIMENGDFVKITFEMRIGTDKQLVATNNEELAKANDIYDPDQKYNEGVLIVGSEDIFKEINESLLKANPGDENEVEIKAENAYGVRDPKNIKVHTYAEFQRNKIDPVPGQEVRINNRRGKVLSVSPGRVVVDYNHPWSGKDVFYKYKILSKIDSVPEKIKALIDQNFTPGSDKFDVKETGNEITVEVPEEFRFNVEWFDAKYRVVENTRKYLKEYTISMVEKYEPKSEEVPAETPKADQSMKEEEGSKEEPKEAANEA